MRSDRETLVGFGASGSGGCLPRQGRPVRPRYKVREGQLLHGSLARPPQGPTEAPGGRRLAVRQRIDARQANVKNGASAPSAKVITARPRPLLFGSARRRLGRCCPYQVLLVWPSRAPKPCTYAQTKGRVGSRRVAGLAFAQFEISQPALRLLLH